MNCIHVLITLTVLIAGCTNVQRVDRDIFSLGDDSHEISKHAEEKKSIPDMDMLLRVKLSLQASTTFLVKPLNVSQARKIPHIIQF